jgi:hypothetical protein
MTCRDCGKEISTLALACPQCGRPVERESVAPPPPLDPKPTFKTLKVLLMIGIPAYIACVFVVFALVAEDKPTDSSLLNHLLNGVAGAVGAALVAGYIVSLVISGLKGKPFFVAIGILTLPMPAFSFLPIMGAIRMAKPNSKWARKYYDVEKMRIARTRFPNAQ